MSISSLELQILRDTEGSLIDALNTIRSYAVEMKTITDAVSVSGNPFDVDIVNNIFRFMVLHDNLHHLYNRVIDYQGIINMYVTKDILG